MAGTMDAVQLPTGLPVMPWEKVRMKVHTAVVTHERDRLYTICEAHAGASNGGSMVPFCDHHPDALTKPVALPALAIADVVC